MGDVSGPLSVGREGHGCGEGVSLTGGGARRPRAGGARAHAARPCGAGRGQAEALAATGKFELGPGALPCLASELARSPFLAQDLPVDLLARALAAFYELRGEVDASVSDEEVARALRVALDAVTAEDVAACRDGARWGEGACCDGGDWPDDACHDGDAAPDGGWAILQDAPWGDDWRDGLAPGGLPSDTDEGEGRE